jgi:hypothetical protein
VNTNFFGANLKNANLEGANLLKSDLREANLENTNLSETYLYFVKTTDAKMNNTKLDDIVAPEGFREKFGKGESIVDLDWKFDGAVTSQGCRIIGGSQISYNDDSELVDTCKYRDKLLRIAYGTDGVCGASVTTWMDPETGDIFTFPSTCGHPKFCNSEKEIRLYNGDNYAMGNALIIPYDDSRKVISISYEGNICYVFTTIEYLENENVISVNADGQWKTAIATLETDLKFPDNLKVIEDGKEIDYFKDSRYTSSEKDVLQLTFDLQPNASIKKILISPKDITYGSPDETKANEDSFKLETCDEGLYLLFKSMDHSPVCVRSKTIQKLIDRGWTKFQ